MFIKEINIKNFRGITEFHVVMSNNMLSIVGQNDVGKSSVLRAVCIFFGEEKITMEDFPKHNLDLPIEIEILFHTDDKKLEQFKVDNALRLKQVFKLVNGKITTEKSIFLENSNSSMEELDKYQQLKTIGTKLGIEFPKTKPDDAKIEQLKQQVFEKINSMGKYSWQDVSTYWEEIKSKFPNVVYIPAAQDYENEQKVTNDTSAFGKLFRVGVKKWLKADEDSQNAVEILTDKLEEINKKILSVVERNLKQQVVLAEKLSPKMEPLDVSRGFSFTIYVTDEHGVQTPLYNRGSGLQRAVLVAAIRSQSEVEQMIEELKSTNEKDDSHIEVDETHIPSTLYIFEEPEAFLHLGAQKELFYSLKDLAQKGNQVILTTHSTLFIDETDTESIVLLKREKGQTYSLQHISGEYIRDELGENIRISQLITGKICCIVEGMSDKFAFLAWMNKLGYDTKRLGIHFISMDGCENVDYFANISILNDFQVPFLIILDNDYHGKTKNNEKKEKLEKKFPKLKYGYIKLLNGELENCFPIAVVSEVLNIPEQYIDKEKYRLDPKQELNEALRKAQAAGVKNARRYKEVEHSRKIASRMVPVQISDEVIEIIEELVKLATEQNKEEKEKMLTR